MAGVAYTDPKSPYPQFVNFTKNENGSVRISVRAPATLIEGSRVCGYTCSPGGEGCNNHCGMHPNRENMTTPDRPEPFTYTDSGATCSMTIPYFEFRALVLGLMKL